VVPCPKASSSSRGNPHFRPHDRPAIVEDDDRSIFIAGDASYTADRATVYLPSHDPGSAARLAERRVVPTREAKQAAGARA
jgi:hypothetical protein